MADDQTNIWPTWPAFPKEVPDGAEAQQLLSAELASRKAKDITAVLLEEYKDHGYWARHYSTVRLTLGTFFMTAAAGFIVARLDKPDRGGQWIATGIASFGAALYLFFSVLTFKKMNKQRAIVNAYRFALAQIKTEKPLWTFFQITVLPVALLFLGAVIWFAFWRWPDWAPKPPTPASTSTQSKAMTIPVTVKVGGGNGVVLDVPVEVKGP